MKNLCNVFFLILSALILSGCAAALLETPYERPDVILPEAWQGKVTNNDVTQHDRWWTQFNDQELTILIDHVLEINNDLVVAALRVERARLQAGLADTNLTPSVSVGADGSVSRNLDGGSSNKRYGTSLSLSYEIDLWGKLARTRDAAYWELQATEFDRLATRLSLIGTTAQLYWQIAAINQRIANSEANLANAERTLQLVLAQKNAGAVSALNVVQSEQSLASQRASHESLLMQRDQLCHAFSVLFDQPPNRLQADTATLSMNDPPRLREGLPAELLSRRPDLAAAEFRLRKLLAQQDVTRAQFYPSISLTGSLGTSSDELRDFLQNPVAALGARLILPFIEWNTTRLTIQVAKVEYEEAVINFRKTLYASFIDVEDALSARAHYEAQRPLYQTAFDAARRAEAIAEERYRVGQTGVQDWLDAQSRRRSAEDTIVQNQYDRLVTQMNLYRALGGDDH
ncbi:MAG: efflux transporter outer membrane subunit [Burkholderiales bacterium]|jgi:NodT family efflux transporter outer membrane factor (OMF) lipoprotein|nr:efflux transporter outer membrane subunit [Burkholderiales bacterium]